MHSFAEIVMTALQTEKAGLLPLSVTVWVQADVRL